MSPHRKAARRTAQALDALRAANEASAANTLSLEAMAASDLAEQDLADALHAALRQIEQQGTES
jgi:hypothetical protein